MKSSAYSLIVILLSVSIVGCSNMGGNKWPAEYKETFLSGCVDGASSSGQEIFNTDKAKIYCSCTLEVLESRYSAEEMEDKWKTAMEELVKDGTLKSCLQKAGVPVP
jgi:hypothetical protein